MPPEHVAQAQSSARNNLANPHSFAEAVKVQYDRALPRATQATKPKRSAAASKRDTAKPGQQMAPSTSLIVDLAAAAPPRNPTLTRCVGSLTTTLTDGSQSAPRPPHETTVAPLLRVADPIEPPFYPADPWHSGLPPNIHDTAGVLPSSRDFGRSTESGTCGFLHGRDAVLQEEVTVRVDFLEEEDAQ
ncbi:hypothetical protein B0H19DRAFT_1074482 [Mycena capillaripes]|nr:hypothetical protein B0H19DRAFT_1074482 [Mycena capillaripes]